MGKIGIIGSGVVAKTLASGFIKHGHKVMIGSRDISKLLQWKAENAATAQLGSFNEAAVFGDTIVLAVKGQHAANALRLAGAKQIAGKTVIDATNPIDDEKGPQDGVLHFFTEQNDSLMENLQSEFRDAHFVKAFNSIGSAFMVNPSFEMKPTMFICGNNDNAKTEVRSILDQFGWESEDLGTATAARAIEPLCMLWCIPGFRNNRWSHAFRLMTK